MLVTHTEFGGGDGYPSGGRSGGRALVVKFTQRGDNYAKRGRQTIPVGYLA